MNTNEGYTIYVIPEQRIKSCSGCKYYEHQLVVSGRNPIYSNNCRHPERLNKPEFVRSGGFPAGNLDSDNTPSWCPTGERILFSKKEMNDLHLDNELPASGL
jgi:hypothetical protein